VARSIKKGAYINEKLLDKVRRAEESGSKSVIKTWSRRSTVTPELIGHTFAVHNGKKFIPIFVTENMVGHNSVNLRRRERFFSHAGDRKTKVRK